MHFWEFDWFQMSFGRVSRRLQVEFRESLSGLQVTIGVSEKTPWWFREILENFKGLKDVLQEPRGDFWGILDICLFSRVSKKCQRAFSAVL